MDWWTGPCTWPLKERIHAAEQEAQAVGRGLARCVVMASTLRTLTDPRSAPRADRRRRLNAKRKAAMAPDVGLRILEAAAVSHAPAIDTAKFPHAGSGFVGRDDRSDTRKLRAHSGESTVSLDGITREDSMGLLDPQCPQKVRRLVSECGYTYIVNDIKSVVPLNCTPWFH